MAEIETNERQQGSQVRARILIPFAILILTITGAFLIAAYLFEDREREESLTASVAAAESLYHQGIEKDSDIMHAALIAIARDKGIKEAFLNRNREALLKRAWPLFDELRKNNNITHFYFTGVDRKNFLRVHKPDQFGDTIDRITMLRAEKEQEVARGIELGVLGTFTLRIVLPWYDGDRLIGYLELGEEIDSIAEEVHRILGADLLVLVNDRVLDLQHWETGRKMLGHQSDWRRFGSMVVVGRAMKKIPPALIRVLERDDRSYKGVLRMEEDEKDLFVAFLPITDVSGGEVGDLVVVQDVTGQQKGFRDGMAGIAILSLLVGSLVFAIFYVILSRVDRDSRRQREVELQLLRINTEHQKIIQVEKLSAMGLMIGEIAHQLNNPLVGVVNMTQLAQREANDPARTRELLAEIGRAGKDCHAFVSRMLVFTKMSSFDRMPTDMNMLIEESISLFKHSMGKRQQVTTGLPGEAPILNVDPILIRHAVFNLLSNAAQASTPGGVITVRLYPEVQAQDRTPGWCLSVQDEGSGLSDDIRDKIFTPFFTTHPEGTGLGLPVVQHVAFLHDGQITATNAEGGGAIFVLWLPDRGDRG